MDAIISSYSNYDGAKVTDAAKRMGKALTGVAKALAAQDKALQQMGLPPETLARVRSLVETSGQVLADRAAAELTEQSLEDLGRMVQALPVIIQSELDNALQDPTMLGGQPGKLPRPFKDVADKVGKLAAAVKPGSLGALSEERTKERMPAELLATLLWPHSYAANDALGRYLSVVAVQEQLHEFGMDARIVDHMRESPTMSEAGRVILSACFYLTEMNTNLDLISQEFPHLQDDKFFIDCEGKFGELRASLKEVEAHIAEGNTGIDADLHRTMTEVEGKRKISFSPDTADKGATLNADLRDLARVHESLRRAAGAVAIWCQRLGLEPYQSSQDAGAKRYIGPEVPATHPRHAQAAEQQKAAENVGKLTKKINDRTIAKLLRGVKDKDSAQAALVRLDTVEHELKTAFAMAKSADIDGAAFNKIFRETMEVELELLAGARAEIKRKSTLV